MKKLVSESDAAELLIVTWSNITERDSTPWFDDVANGDSETHTRIAQFTIDQSADAVYWVREDGSLAYFNETAASMLGYSREEMAALLVMDINPDYPTAGRLVVLTERVALNGNIQVFSAEAPRGDFIKVEVSDTGMGMNSNVMERLFEPFFTTKEVGKGTGLGLSQVYGFVSQSEGYISVNSKESFGTRVAIYLPTAEPEAKPVSERDVKPETARGGHEKILVVEDNNEVRDVAVGMLRELGYEVVPATDGNDALKLLDQHDDIELLFTDVMMPGGYSGPALAAKARETRLQLKVLYCSGYSEAVFAEHEVDEQEVDIIAKSFSRLELAKRVRDILDG